MVIMIYCLVLIVGTGRVSPTQRSCLTGTYAYRAPELLRGLPPCARADVYSFGVTMWEMLSRRQVKWHAEIFWEFFNIDVCHHL